MVSGRAATIADGMVLAVRAVDRGDARRTLDQLVAISTADEFAAGARA